MKKSQLYRSPNNGIPSVLVVINSHPLQLKSKKSPARQYYNHIGGDERQRKQLAQFPLLALISVRS